MKQREQIAQTIALQCREKSEGAWEPSIAASMDMADAALAVIGPASVQDAARKKALDDVLKEVEGYLPEFGAGAPQDGTDLIIDQCWRDFHKVVRALAEGKE